MSKQQPGQVHAPEQRARRPGRRSAGAAVGLLSGVLWLAAGAPAAGHAAAPSPCSYDAATKRVTLDARRLDLDDFGHVPSGIWRLPNEKGGAIWWYDEHDTKPCGAATVANTKTIVVTGGPRVDFFRIEERGVGVADGASFAGTGIRFTVALGGPADDTTEINLAGTGPAQVRIGALGIDRDSDRRVDIRFRRPLPHLTVFGSDVANRIEASGGRGTGDAWAAPVELWGGRLGDVLTGGLAADRIMGQGRDDTIRGLAGRDLLDAGWGDDTIYADDGQADDVYGGIGNDRARADAGLDSLHDVESRF